MANTFGDRLKGAMLSAGISTPTQLAERCSVARSTAEKWLSMPEARVLGTHLITVADCLNVRLRWLASGKGPVRFSPGSEEAMELLDRMSAEQIKRWLATGRRMFRPPRGSGGGRPGS